MVSITSHCTVQGVPRSSMLLCATPFVLWGVCCAVPCMLYCSSLRGAVDVCSTVCMTRRTSLVVCYTAAVLGVNAGVVLLSTCVCMWSRSGYGVAHMYIGQGQHVLLRISLGLIETLSGSFRAVSLSLRIVCNATAGHVLLAVLIEMTCSSISYPYASYVTILSMRSGCMSSDVLGHVTILGSPRTMTYVMIQGSR